MHNRATGLRVLTGFGCALFLTALAMAGDGLVLTNIGQIRALAPLEIARKPPVRLEAVVTLYTAPLSYLWVQDEFDGVPLLIQNRKFEVKAGDRVRVTGRAVLVEDSAFVEPDEVEVLEKGKLPEPLARTAQQLNTFADENQRVQAEGRVLDVTESGRRWHLELESGNSRFWLEVPKRTNENLPALMGATVRGRGVCTKQAFTWGEKVQPALLVGGLSDLAILQPARTNVSIDPYRIAAQPISSLTRQQALTKSNSLVRVQGAVLDQRPGESIVVRDDTGTLFAETLLMVPVKVNERVDLWGTPVWDGYRLYLKDSTFHLLVSDRPAPEEIAAAPAPNKPAELPLLTQARQIRDLPPGQSAWGYPVRLRGVVTLYLPLRKKFFVQDDTAGIYVRLDKNQPGLKTGDSVEIEGVSNPGGFAPIVVPTNITVMGTAPLPEPLRATLFQLATGQYDSQWIEAHGVVRSRSFENGLLQLKLSDPSGMFTVDIPAASEPTNLLDAVVHVRGVCASKFNDKRQLASVTMWSPGMDYVQIEEPGVADPFSLPTKPILSLSQFQPRETLQRRVEVAGVVTFCQPGQSFFVQDASGAIQVFTSQNDELKPGDQVLVAGYPALGSFSSVLRDAVFRVKSHGPLPAPKLLASEHALEGDLDNTWVQIDARLLSRSTVSHLQVLTLQLAGWVFEAQCLAPAEDRELPPAGSLLRLTGVYHVLADETRSPSSFQLLVPSFQDLQVLDQPPWWTTGRLVTAGGVMALIAAAATLWVLLLRHRVSEQTRRLREQVERETVLETHYRDMFEGAQDLIFTHDPEGRFTSLNPAACRVLGYSAKEAKDLTIDQVLAPEYHEHGRQLRETVLSAGKVAICEGAFITKDGRRVLIEISLRMTFKDGRPAAVHGIARDITERKRAEAALGEASGLLETLLANSPDVIYFKDRQSRFVRFSKAFEKLFKVANAEELRGKSDFDFFTEEHARPAFEDEQEIIRTGQPIIGKLEKETHPDGRVTWALTTKMPWRDNGGNIIGTFGISKDVTAIKEAEDRLAQTSGLLEGLLENSPDYIYFKDSDSRFIRCSKSLCDVMGSNPRDIVGKSDFDFYSKEEAQLYLKDEQEIVRTGKPLVGKAEHNVWKNGQSRWSLTTKLPLRDKDGRIIGTYGVSKDITTLKEAEDRLAQTGRLLETLLANSPDTIYFKDRESRYVRLSQSEIGRSRQIVIERFHAEHPSEQLPPHLASMEEFSKWLVGKTDFDVYRAENARPYFENEQEIMRTGKPIIGRVEQAKLSSGGVLWVMTTKMPWCDERGNIIGTFGMSRDVTAIKETEDKLAHEQELLQTLLDNLPDCIYFKDRQSRFVRFSKAFEKLFKVANAEELRGKSDFDFFTEEHARPAFEDEQEIIRTGKPIVGKLERETHPDGRVTWALTTKMPWRDRGGNTIGTFGVSRDVTALKEAETELAEVNQRLIETSRFAGMAEVATDVLHNVGNVLNSVNVSCSLVVDRVKESSLAGLPKVSALLEKNRARLAEFLTADPQGREIPSYLAALAEYYSDEQSTLLRELEQLRENVDHIKQIVAMQQSYAKVAGVTETINVPQLVDDALQINAAALNRHKIEVRREFSESPPILAERHKALQILVNLIRNAKYALDEANRPDRLLMIKVGNDGNGRVKIQVIDNGVGIPPENLTRIFAHGFTTRRNGHGFGLHSSALAARELGGTLQAHSDGTGRGAAFTLVLPPKPPAAST